MATESRADVNLECESAFMRILGLRFEQIGPERVTASFETGLNHHQPWGLVHGGVFTAVIETVATTGAYQAVRDRGQLGLSLYAIVMLPWTVRTLGRFGVPGAAVLRDHALVTSGPFRLVRHPGYSAILALWLGAALGTLNWLLLALWPLLLAGVFVSSRAEERLLREKFGTTYDAYAAKTGRFIPKVWGAAEAAEKQE